MATGYTSLELRLPVTLALEPRPVVLLVQDMVLAHGLGGHRIMDTKSDP